MQSRVVLSVMIWALISCAVALADTVELTNGDLLSGKVAGVTADQVLLTSDVLGEVKLPRAKVAAIHFGDRKPVVAAKVGAAAVAPVAPAKALPAEPSVDDVLNQLKAGAGGGDLTKMLAKEFPLLQNPEVKAYFEKTVGGLMSGELNVGDIRKQALDVRQQVKDLEKDLGPEGMAALKPYLSVLDKFINDTEPRGGEATAPAKQRTPDAPKRP
jgi:hypothetical protein